VRPEDVLHRCVQHRVHSDGSQRHAGAVRQLGRTNVPQHHFDEPVERVDRGQRVGPAASQLECLVNLTASGEGLVLISRPPTENGRVDGPLTQGAHETDARPSVACGDRTICQLARVAERELERSKGCDRESPDALVG
jgi:hypothetical protein